MQLSGPVLGVGRLPGLIQGWGCDLKAPIDFGFGEVIVEKRLRSYCGVMALGAIALLGGCAAEGAAGGDPGARPLPPGMSCQSVREELNALDARGAAAKVEAVNSGRRVSESDRAVAQKYNTFLSYYLGGRCHV